MDSNLHRFAHHAMACEFEVFILNEEPDYAQQAAAAAFAEADRLERELSRFLEASDVSRINALRAGESVAVGIDTFECLRLALRIQKETRGAFDVTFRSRRPRTRAKMPNQLRLALDPANHSVAALFDGVQVDLGAIGKGYAVDRMAALLRDDWKISAALLHAGQSSVLAVGAPPGKTGWPVALRDPVTQTETLGTLTLKNAALGGSGQLIHGQHILDPRTGRPAKRLGSWAYAPSAAETDALSTVFLILPPARIRDYCAKHPTAAALFVATRQGRRRIACVGNCPLKLHDPATDSSKA